MRSDKPRSFPCSFHRDAAGAPALVSRGQSCLPPSWPDASPGGPEARCSALPGCVSKDLLALLWVGLGILCPRWEWGAGGEGFFKCLALI